MEFTEEIGNILFDGYVPCFGNDTKRPQAKSKLRNFAEARGLKYVLGKIKRNVILADYDELEAFECRLAIAEGLQEHCIAIRTDKGGHIYWFNNDEKIYVSNTGNKTLLTLKPVDYKCGIRIAKTTGEITDGAGWGRLSKTEYTFREVVYCNIKENNELDEIPFYDLPLKTGDKFSFLNMAEGESGGRQTALFSYMNPIKAAGYSYDQYKTLAEIINNYVFETPLQDEFENAIRPEAWESINIANVSFGKGSSFRTNDFAKYMVEKYHTKLIDEQLHIFKDGIYVSKQRDIENIMLQEIDWLSTNKRKDILETMKLFSSECSTNDKNNLNYIAFKNGLYDLNTGELVNFTPDIVILNKIPWNYNPAASSDLVGSVLDKLSCNDKEIRALLEECAGACLYRDNRLGGGKMFILTGAKSNGKSTFIKMLQFLLGKDNYSSLELKEVNDRFKPSMMFGKLANLGDDISCKYIDETGVIKKIATGDRFTVEYKGKTPFAFEPYCTMVFSANDIPRTRDRTGAVQRRLLLVPFNAKFSKNDADFDPFINQKLIEPACMEYLVILGIRALKKVLEKGFTESNKVQEQLEEYERENNPVIGFVSDCDFETEILHQQTKDVYRAYTIYCAENGLSPLGNVQFSKELCSRYNLESRSERRAGKKVRCFEEKRQ